MRPFFTIENVYIGIKKLASLKRSPMYKGFNVQMYDKETTCMDK